MESALEALLARAFGRTCAAEANVEIDRARGSIPGSRSYELVLNPAENFRAAADRIVPRLVYQLESTKARLPDCRGVFLSVFVGEDLYFIHARDAMAFFVEYLGTTATELARDFGPDRIGPPNRRLLT